MRKHLLVSALLVSLLAACSSTPKPESSGAAVEDRGADSSSSVARVDATQPSGSGIAALRDPKNILSKREIFFDFDSYVIREEAKPLVEAHARFLVGNPTMKMLIQGNADERGSREYNLALGQKRSDATKQAMVLLGAKEGQIESVSLGEEKPRCTERTEDCYAQNRRADILYSGEF
jgi:peptidoglycan-associated lipoprotein